MPIRGSRFSRFLDFLPFVFVQNPLSRRIKLVFPFSIHLSLYPISLEVRSTRSSHQIFFGPSRVTALAPLSIFYSHILFPLAISLDLFLSCSILCKKGVIKGGVYYALWRVYFCWIFFALMLVYDCAEGTYRQPPYNTIFLQHDFNIFNIIISYGIKQYFSIFDILIWWRLVFWKFLRVWLGPKNWLTTY